jgi:hypothetical protein
MITGFRFYDNAQPSVEWPYESTYTVRLTKYANIVVARFADRKEKRAESLRHKIDHLVGRLFSMYA